MLLRFAVGFCWFPLSCGVGLVFGFLLFVICWFLCELLWFVV